MSGCLGTPLLLALCLVAAPSFAEEAARNIEHTVEPGETLWSIAAQADVYADPYLWPVIYKFNRDQITDPSRIYPRQTLQIPVEIDAAARAAARAEAGATGAKAGATGAKAGATGAKAGATGAKAGANP